MLSLALALAAAAAGEPLLQEVAPGVFVALQPEETRFDDANVAVLVGERALLVVDAPADAERVAQIAAEIRRRFDRPVRYLVTTHWHGDHTQGGAVLRDAFEGQLVVVGHRTLVEDVPGRAGAALRERVATLEGEIAAAEERLRRGVKRDGSALTVEERPRAEASIARAAGWVARNHDARFLAPDLALEDGLRLDLGGLTVELMHLVAHTRGDVAVWVPERGVLVAGDVVDDLPYVGHGYPRRWLAGLDRLASLAPTTVVPGHGPLFPGTAQVGRVRGYLADLVAGADRARASGRELPGVGEDFDAARWRAELARDEAAGRFFDAVLDEALARAMHEERLVGEESAVR
jgi:glyoxylase-like metal-dependent hydrolase (beta-lactamase superfamily II)